MLNEIQQNIANAVMLSFVGKKPTSEEILEKVSKFADLFCYTDDMEIIVKSVEATMNCTMEMGVCITEIDAVHDRDWVKRITRDEKIYSLSYEALLKNKGMSPQIVDTISKSNDEILGLIDDPKKNESFQRRGLVIGDVQSGKTGNYLSLVTKAADAGYRFIIIIAGIHNNLRRQTQQRVDEGFVGRTGQNSEKIGVGKSNVLAKGNYPHPMALTSQDNDFKSSFANQFRASINDTNVPQVLVIKKNTATLKSLYGWLVKHNQINSATNKIETSMLMIDDESDNASVNTNQLGDDPTKTNDYLRKILHLFSKSAYIGYTATPFANIFMDPDSYEDAYEDLFPKDFIYCLNAPTNYFGPKKIFLNEDEDLDERIPRTISILNEEEVDRFFPKGHKKTLKVNGIPESLKRAILTFLVAKAIRNLRGQSLLNCSMLINVSTFTNVQEQIKGYVNSYLTMVENELVVNGNMPDSDSYGYIKQLKEIYEKDFAGSSNHFEEIFDWIKVKEELIHIFDNTPKDYIKKTFVVNSKSQDSLDYEEPNKKGVGLMAIAIGGFSLSRGLTIEGLTVSYFFRSTKMYDTLLQMGRWFGYRPNYEDLCRIFMTEESYYWYQHIAVAVQDLRDQIASMNQNKQSPQDFGLYVRSSEDGLLVTARNKSRRGEAIEIPISFSGQLKEFDKLTKNTEIQRKNYELFRAFWNDLNQSIVRPLSEIKSNRADIYLDVETGKVLEFLRRFDLGYKKDISSLVLEKVVDYLDKISTKYPAMDVVFMTVSRKEVLNSFDEINPAERTIRNYKFEEDFYRLNKSRVGGQEDEKYGLSEDQLHTEDKNKANHYRRQRKKPLLLLYLIKIKFPEDFTDRVPQSEEKIPTLAMSFPYGDDNTSVTVLANQIYNKTLLEDLGEDTVGDDHDK